MPTLRRPLFGPDDPRGPSRGPDVLVVKRALAKVEAEFFPKPAGGYDDVYNRRCADAVKTFQRIEDISPATGNLGQRTLDALWPYVDAYGRWRYRTFLVPKPAPPPPIEPVQGFKSLHESLWEAYSLGRRMGLSDLGTYNPASTLPSGGPSDHSVYPARAFDLGIDPDTGWANEIGRAFFMAMVDRPEISYVILGDRIWSAARASEGIRPYGYGGHEGHVHTSGRR